MQTEKPGRGGHLPPTLDETLFTPSLATARAPANRPWRLQSQMWVAFFGGALALAAIAYMNARLLRVDNRTLRRLALVSVGGVIASLVVTVGVGLFASPDSDLLRNARWLNRGVALLLFVVLRRIQAPADRAYQMFYDGEYSSLWRMGLLAVFGLGTLQSLLSAALIAGLR